MMYKRYRKRRYKKKGRFGGYGRFMSNAGKTAATALTALKIAKTVKDMVNVEYKYKDFNADTTIDNTWDIGMINIVPQDDTATGRDGDSIRMKSVQIEGTATINPSATTTQVTFAIVQWKNPNSSNLTALNVFANNGFNSLRNAQKMSDYRILYKKKLALSINGTRSINFKMYKKINLQSKWTGTTGSYTECMKNGLWVLIISSEATNTPTVEYEGRIRYIDN